ncbi:hypothetical protein ACLB2K_049146 [Fragaria x ananassa]
MSVPADLKKLDEYLLSRSYITGYQASKDDITVLAALAKAPSSQYVNVLRWYKHIEALLSSEDFAPAGEEEDDDDVDLFGEETEEDKKAAEERAASIKASAKKKEFRWFCKMIRCTCDCDY